MLATILAIVLGLPRCSRPADPLQFEESKWTLMQDPEITYPPALLAVAMDEITMADGYRSTWVREATNSSKVHRIMWVRFDCRLQRWAPMESIELHDGVEQDRLRLREPIWLDVKEDETEERMMMKQVCAADL